MSSRGGANRALVGVIGGIGPLATAYFLDRVVRLTEADRDQDHVDMVVFHHATIPDRTTYILGGGDDPGPVMAADARALEGLGVSFLVMPCNTAHYFTDQVAAAVQIPVLSIIDETVSAARARNPGLRSVGLLATEGTVLAGVYQRALAAAGLGCLLPDAADQAGLMEVIYDQVKAGRPVDIGQFRAISGHLLAAGAQVLILGCTELSVIATDFDLLAEPEFVDSLDVLARSTIGHAGHTVSSRPEVVLSRP